MRAALFKKLMLRLKQHPSGIYQKLQLQVLLSATSVAFLRKSKCILFTKDPLKEYMLYTKECSEADRIDLERVYSVAYGLGKRIAKITGFTEPDDLKKLVYFLYQYIGIDMTGALPGEFCVKGCYFSRYYKPENCRVMSAMDSGIIAGICSGICPKGRLVFTKRLTENCNECLAAYIRNNE